MRSRLLKYSFTCLPLARFNVSGVADEDLESPTSPAGSIAADLEEFLGLFIYIYIHRYIASLCGCCIGSVLKE